MCHFNICSNVHDSYKRGSNSLKSWADYLFSNMENAPEEARFGVVEEDVLRMNREHDHRDIVLEEDDDIYEKGDTLKSFHHQVRQPISRTALLAGFLSAWLKRCVVPSPSKGAYSPDDSAAGHSLGARSLSGATPNHGVLHAARSSCTDGSLL